MTNLPLLPDEPANVDDTPLPLIVAKRWNFPLAHVQTENGMFYAVQDWIRGLVTGEVRYALAKLRRTHPELNAVFRMLPYKSTDSKVYQRPYADENRLMSILLKTRVSRGRHRLVEIRNFIASLSTEYEYIKCSPTQEKGLTEYEFQSSLVSGLKSSDHNCQVFEYFPTLSGRKVDVLMLKQDLRSDMNLFPVLVECKVDCDEFFKAVGQVMSYSAELSRTWDNDTRTTLAIAMPYELIDDYMRSVSNALSIRLISIVKDSIIDAVSGEPFHL